jgi:LysM repeat protein
MSVALQLVAPAPIPDRAAVSVRRTGADATVHRLFPPVAAPLARPVRLTRRGVLVLAALVLALCIGLVTAAALSAGNRAGAPAGQAVPAAVTVHSGDTLWALAQRYAPASDPVAEIARLQRLNGLDGVGLVPGQVLRLR